MTTGCNNGNELENMVMNFDNPSFNQSFNMKDFYAKFSQKAMSPRETIAAMALQGLLQEHQMWVGEENPEAQLRRLAKQAIMAADLLLEELNREADK